MRKPLTEGDVKSQIKGDTGPTRASAPPPPPKVLGEWQTKNKQKQIVPPSPKREKAKLEKQKDLLFGYVEIEAYITCTKCGHNDTVFGLDEWGATLKFIQDGWYATENNVYCILCNDKRLKK